MVAVFFFFFSFCFFSFGVVYRPALGGFLDGFFPRKQTNSPMLAAWQEAKRLAEEEKAKAWGNGRSQVGWPYLAFLWREKKSVLGFAKSN